jgi:hypothetical protein
MDMIIFEDRIKYDAWIKVLLVLGVVSLVLLGVLFYLDAQGSEVFRGAPAAESRTSSGLLFVAAVFLLLVYWLILPRAISVSQEAVVVQFSAFRWKIPFRTIESIKAARGIIVWWAHSWITSYATQIEIRRRYRFKIRVSPARRDQFLEYANKALADWRSAHSA